MKRLFENRIFLGVICFIIGAGAMYAVQAIGSKPKHQELRFPRNVDSFLDDPFKDDFFDRSHDPFEQMRKMRQRMLKNFVAPDDGGGVGDISRREDDKYVFYDIAIKGLKQEKVNVRVEDGQITISGQVENTTEDEGAQSFTNSSFHRSFPVRMELSQIRFKWNRKRTS